MTDTYAVIGNPVAHSRSPFIHQQFAKQTHQVIRYLKITAPLDSFAEEVKRFAQVNGKGLNVTIPFKQQAFGLVTDLSQRARIAKSVNTIKFMPDGRLWGDNTDGVGLIRDVTIHHQYAIRNTRILILGAGGATRGILYPLLKLRPAELVIANRTFMAAENLAAEFKQYGPVVAKEFDTLTSPYDAIFHATSLSLGTESIPFPTAIIDKNTFCYDLMYGQKPTPFLKWAVSSGAFRITDGTGMLVEQAAESFYIWRGVKPETKAIIEMLKTPSPST